MKTEKISVLLIDDHPIVLQGLQHLLHHRDDMEMAGSFTNATDALQFIRENPVDIVLQDISLPDMHGIELCREIRKILPQARILALSNHNERSIITQMLQSGAVGYILKNASAEEVITAIQDARQGKLVLTQPVQKILVQASSSEFTEMPQLTRREKEILQRIAGGFTTAQIADELFISPLTVETHRRNLMQKFKVSNAPSLIKLAAEYKLV